MAEPERFTPPTLGSISSGKQQSAGRQRTIASCLTCRRRKVRCDHGHPTCGACLRGNHVCTYASDQGSAHHPSPLLSSRVTKTSPPGATKLSRNADVQSRLDRLETLLEQAVGAQKPEHRPSTNAPNDRQSGHEYESELTPSSGSGSSLGAGISSDGHDGTLLLEDGQSQFVSSLHWALLADEIQDIKALLGDRSEQDSAERLRRPATHALGALFALESGTRGINLSSFLPESQAHCESLLNIFFSNVDPMTRIFHHPTLLRRFDSHVREANPIAFAIFFSAINSLKSSTVKEMFNAKKDVLLEKFQQGLEVSLARDNFLTTSSLEVLQGFLLWLTCITKEDDMGKAWTLLGLAIRIALNQGLHRDPALFPVGSMDVVTIELRRRLWHQICHLEFRAAECKGQEPTVADDDFTTLMPRNVNDEDLVEGASPSPDIYDDTKFTDMTFQLVRFNGMRCLRRIVQSTYRLERRILGSGLRGTSAPDPVQELQLIYKEMQLMVEEMLEENRLKYLRYCSLDVPLQRLCLGLASLLEWRSWVLFWLRIPRAYREAVFSTDIRKMIFEKSVNLIETINGATADADAERFRWHIGGHAAFQAIMHVLSELRNPDFETPDRLRALRALQISRRLKENVSSKAWLVVKSMIDKVISDHFASQLSRPNCAYPPSISAPIHEELDCPPNKPMELPSEVPVTDMGPSLYVEESPLYPTQSPTGISDPFGQIDFGQMNLNSIAGMDMQDVSMDLNWGFWGDPVDLDPVEYTI
ncbi:hypothetical protein AOQ84DRAFT_381310 [Glonium stellatum]|uniref:Zn(2)-C6 fungal-type domain-containing protein n=1 Tax=Glonium stellatum TaxID=574774 RepID=A0A8E2ES04_9PEZI|nr:hypothetical protein AOQ84DRAFT_381310 [Glonium stellatum]